VINKNSIIHQDAQVSSTAQIGPYVVIGPNVKIGANVTVHSHVNISGDTSIDDGCKIFPFASIGNDPQDLKYKGEAFVDNKKMADAQWSATIVDRK